MKKCLPLFLTLLMYGMNSFSQKENIDDSLVDCLEITGKMDKTMREVKGDYSVKVILNNKVVDQSSYKIDKGFEFLLKKGKAYTIKLEKEGFIPKLIDISTIVPKNLDIDRPYRFHLETNLMSQELYNHFDSDDMDFPVALVSYKKTCDCFEFDKKYMDALVNRMLRVMMYGQ